METIKVKYEGIDGWNRPVFKAVESRERFGSVNILFNYGDTKEMVLADICEADLCYFGNAFDCEPAGTAAINLEIVQ